MGRCRFNNIPSLLAYMRRMSEGTAAVEQRPRQALAYEDEREEEIMLGLRTSLGIPLKLLKNAYSRVGELERGGFMSTRKGRVSLTTRGMFVSNAVIAELCMERRQ